MFNSSSASSAGYTSCGQVTGPSSHRRWLSDIVFVVKVGLKPGSTSFKEKQLNNAFIIGIFKEIPTLPELNEQYLKEEVEITNAEKGKVGSVTPTYKADMTDEY